MGSAFRVVAFAALIALGACSQAPAPPAAAKLFTLFDVQALYSGGAPGDQAVADNDGLPGGILLKLILDRPASDGSLTLAARSAWSDNQLVAFLTTEVWVNYPQVWMQPVYVPVTRTSTDGPLQFLGGTSQPIPIFSVGPASAFYSPFLQIVYAEVPADTAPGALTSARQILDRGYPLKLSGGRTMPLVPDKVALPAMVDLPPKVDLPTDVSPPETGYLDGAVVSFLDFGPSMFTWDPDTNVVQEAAIYVLTFIGPDGKVLASPAIPTVLGAGPSGSGVALPGGMQRNSAYYRVHTVVMPTTARVFVQPGSDLYKALDADLQAFTGIAPGVSDLQIAKFSGRVALDGRRASATRRCSSPPRPARTTASGSGPRLRWRRTWISPPRRRPPSRSPGRSPTSLPPNQDGSVTAVPGPVAPLEPREEGRRRGRRSALGYPRLGAARAAGHRRADAEPEPEPINDSDGYTPAAEGAGAPSPLSIDGYIDVGFAKAQGDGTSFAPNDQSIPRPTTASTPSRRR